MAPSCTSTVSRELAVTLQPRRVRRLNINDDLHCTMSGGFIFDPSVAPRHDSQTSTSVLPSNILLSLTPRQEGKLRTHLDNRLLSLERDARKQSVIRASLGTTSDGLIVLSTPCDVCCPDSSHSSTSFSRSHRSNHGRRFESPIC